jgi:hypothetical protein
MPRQSRASLAVIPFEGGANRLRPPDDLNKDERLLWVDLVAGCPDGHFRETDAPLLRQYVTMVCLAERAASELRNPISEVGQKWFSVHQRAVRAMSVLSLRLRLAPSTRLTSRSVGREHDAPVSYYDKMRLEQSGRDD